MIKTGYSFGYAAGKIDEVMDRLVSLDYTHAPIADVNSTFGWVRWRAAAKTAGIKPVYGVSIHVTSSINSKKPVLDLWTFLAVDDAAEVNKLVAMSTEQGRSYPRIGFVPLLKYSQLKEIKGVIKISGPNALLGEFEPMEDLFIGLSPACSKGFIKKARAKGFPFIKAMNNRYPLKDDQQFWEMAVGWQADRKTYPQWIVDDEEWEANLRDNTPATEAVTNYQGIL